MTDEVPTPRRRNVGDIYRASSTSRSSASPAAKSLKPLAPVKTTASVESNQKASPSAEERSPAERKVARRSPRNPHAGRPAVSVRMPTALLTRFDAACEAMDMSGLELTLTAVAESLPELPTLIAQDNAGKHGSGDRTSSQTLSIGGLFELPARPRSTSSSTGVQRIWRTSKQNMDSIDQLVKQVGARDRQQMLLLSLTHYLDQKEP